MLTRGTLNNGTKIGYALGLGISVHRGLPVVEHSGANFGFHTELLRFPCSALAPRGDSTSGRGRAAVEVRGEEYFHASVAGHATPRLTLKSSKLLIIPPSPTRS